MSRFFGILCLCFFIASCNRGSSSGDTVAPSTSGPAISDTPNGPSGGSGGDIPGNFPSIGELPAEIPAETPTIGPSDSPVVVGPVESTPVVVTPVDATPGPSIPADTPPVVTAPAPTPPVVTAPEPTPPVVTAPAPTPPVVTTPVVVPNTGLPNAAYTFESNIVFIQTTKDQQLKFDKAVEIIKKVVATEEFRSRILNHTYNGVKTFVDNGGFTNAQIYQKILDGAEKLFPAKNNAMDMEVELYTDNTSTVIGYTYSSSKRIWVNTKYFNTNSVTSVAANLFHEWLHKVGFGHAVSYSVSRDYSVPYAIGRMIGSIGKQFN